MLASERMAKRAILFDRLLTVDHELALAFGREPSNRNTAVARGLLGARTEICEALIHVGYMPPDVQADAEETKVAHA